jgi:dynein heavy chain
VFICGFRVKQIVISGSYFMNDFREDLKAMYRLAGVKEEGVAFLFTDSQVFNERALVFMNDLLASGNIPGLFPPEDMDDIVGALTARVKAAGIAPERKNVIEYFLNEVRKNLHVILCFSPVGDDFRTRAKRFPALVNCTVIDWFQPWPEQALYSVGKHFLATLPELGSKQVVEGIAAFLPHSFKQVNAAATRFFGSDRRYVYTTPKSYLELLKLYEGLLDKKRSSMDAAISRLENGLAKLRDTAEAVEQIEADLKIKLADAEVKQAEAGAIAEEVAANKAIVEQETNKANAIKAEAEEIATRASATQAEADTALAAAEPAVQQAEAALATLNEKDLASCRTMQRPPPGVGEVFYAVMCLLATVDPSIPVGKKGNVRDKDRTWDNVKKLLLSNVKGLMQALLGFKAVIEEDGVPNINFEEARPYIAMEFFNREGLMMKNSAAAGLCEWVINIVMFRDIYVTVAPLRQALADANAELQGAQTKLAGAVAQVEQLSAELAVLEAKYAEAAATKKAAEEDVARGELRLSLANRLTSALADENVRWGQSVVSMKEEKELLVGDVLLASAFISYIGPFTKEYRDQLIAKDWVPFLEKAAGGSRIPMSNTPNPLAILTDDAEKAMWNSQGLPDDQVSTENAVIVTNTARWPLMIDPQLQGIKWVRGLEAENDLITTRLTNKDMLRQLEFAIEQGKPVLIENVGEKIDAVLNPVIQRSTIKRGTRRYLKLGEKELEFNPAFKLYLHTKLSNPHYPPEVQAETALVNFTVTQAGLEDQLLAMTVQKEREDLARIKTTLIKQQNEFKIKMKQLEDQVLQKLADAEGDITEDVELIESLENTKRIAHDIQEKSAVAQETEATINTIAEKYRSVARRGALLFFIMNSLFKVHTYYIYSLASFVTIFLRAIDLVSGSANPMKDEMAALQAAQAADDMMAGDDEEEEEEDEEDGDESGKDGSSSDSGSSSGSDSDADSVADGKAAESRDESDDEDDGPVNLQIRAGLNDEQLVRRCDILRQSINNTVFQYVKRGMFERDKLMFSTQLTLSILQDSGALSPELVSALVLGAPSPDPGTSGPLSDWIPAAVWARVKGLESVKPDFEKLGDDMQAESERWQKWFDHEKPESIKPPAQYKGISEFHKLLLLRAMRPDRIPDALTSMVAANLGQEYVIQKPFDMRGAFDESTPNVPIFFVLFPGVDPTVWVETLGEKLGITSDAGKFVNISMGQGQDERAMAVLDKFAAEGGWIMLQNVHLMQEWLPLLERKLEAIADTAHKDFRCYISAEPPPLAYLKNMPESLMQGAIKIANEAPADLKSNLVRAWANFSQEEIDASRKPAAYKACLFTLCFYHAVVLGRRRFGQAGWSRVYSFNVGDLRVSADVLMDYINNNEHIPWEDLRYLTGEIFYGGHITSFWDRRTNNTYLQVYLQPGILKQAELGPEFKVPNVVNMEFDDINDYMMNELPQESPPMFGMHPNAEIGYLTSFGQSIFDSVLALSGGSAGSGEGAGSGDSVRNTISSLLERLPENFFMIELEERAQPLLEEQSAPYVLVAIQECTRMNALLDEMRRTLVSLQKGLDGQLNMTDAMEDLSQALSINQVPGRNPFHAVSWENFAWPSRKNLAAWFGDLLARYKQLTEWVANMETPLSVWLPGLFNPTALMTSIMQVVARRQGLPLDNMAVDTHLTTIEDPTEVTEYPTSGLLCHGMYMEGGRWEMHDEAGQLLDPYDDGGVQCAGYVADSRLKELYPPLPLIYLKAVQVEPTWEPTSEGFVRHKDDLYEAPLYQTCFRGPTFVAICPLRTRDPKHKWVLRGTAITMQLDG